MNDVSFFWIAFVAYLVAMFLLVIAALRPSAGSGRGEPAEPRRGSEGMARAGRGLVWLGLLAQTASIVWRAFTLGTEPLHQFLPRLGRAFSAGPAWQAVVYVLLLLVAGAVVAVGVVCRRRRHVWLVAAGLAVVLELMLLDFLDFTRLPIEKIYEYLSLASWCSALALLAVSPRVKLVVVDAALALAACLLVVFAAIQPKTIELQLVPALQSYWLFIHVSLTSLGFAIFGMAFAIAAVFLVRSCDPRTAQPSTRRGAWLTLAVAAAVAAALVAVAALLGKTLPLDEVAYVPHELKQDALPPFGAIQFVRYGAALFGAFAFWACLAFWGLWGLRAWRARERDGAGLGHYLFVVTTLAFFAACLLLAGLVRNREQTIARVRDVHAELQRVKSVLAPDGSGPLTAHVLAGDVKRSRQLSQQARSILAQARWLPLTDDKQAELADDPLLASLADLYAKAGRKWHPPIRYKDIKAIGRSLRKQAALTEAVAARLKLPADAAAIQDAESKLIGEFQRLQATALLPRTPVGQLAAFVGLAAMMALPIALALWWLGLRVRDRLPDPERLDGISYAAIAIAYPVFTFGALFAGMIWAHFAWGAWWSWDPKEVGSLVAWFLYTLYLHQRYRERLSPRTAAVFGMLGFVFASLSIAGNAFLGGLHAYS